MVAEVSVYEIALRWMLLHLTDDKCTLVQVMAWCRQAASHYLSQCWPRSMSPNAVFKINGRPVAPGDQKLGWTSKIWPWASKNYNRLYKEGNFLNISGRLRENFSLNTANGVTRPQWVKIIATSPRGQWIKLKFGTLWLEAAGSCVICIKNVTVWNSIKWQFMDTFVQ